MAKGKKRQKQQAKNVKVDVAKRSKVSRHKVFDDHFFTHFKWAIPILVAVAVALYLPSIQYEFVLDDKIVYHDNQYVQKGLKGVWDILSTESFQGYFGEQKDFVFGARYRPLSIVTFAVEHEFFGLNPKVGHIGNIIFYALSVLLLLRVLSLFFPLKEGQAWWWSIPFIASLLFVLHPLHVEVVANIKGRDEIMTMMGAFGALYGTFKYIDTRKAYWLILSTIAYFLGLLSKENAITFLAVIPAAMYFFRKPVREDYIKTMVPLLITTIIYLIIRYQVIGYFLSSGKEITNLMNNPFVEMTGSEKLATIMYTLGLYLKLLFFPHPLTHDYYPYHIPIMNWTKPGTLISLFIYVGLGIHMLLAWKKRQLTSFLIFFYIATISIVSNIAFPVGTFMNERFVYISSVAFCVFMGYAAIQWIPKYLKPGTFKSFHGLGMLLILAYAAGFTYKTVDRLPAWKNTLSLNEAAIKISKNSARANVFTGTAYFNEYRATDDPEEKARLLDKAAPYIDRALEIHPSYNDALTMKSGIAAERFRVDSELEPLLEALYMVGQYRPNHEFLIQYLEYLSRQSYRNERMEQFYLDLGYRYHLIEKNQYHHGFFIINKGMELMPNNAKLRLAAAKIMEASENNQKAQEYREQAYRLDPNVQLN